MTLAQSLIIIVGSLIVMAVFGVLLNRYLKGQKPEPKETPTEAPVEAPVETPKPKVRKRDPKTGKFIKD